MYRGYENAREARTDPSTGARDADGHAATRRRWGNARPDTKTSTVTRPRKELAVAESTREAREHARSAPSTHQHDSAHQARRAGRQGEKKQDQPHVRPLVPPLAYLIDNQLRVQRRRNKRKIA